jgi:hypothetical protein
MILTADNGGPINLGNANYPLRGGKHTLWDGGVRVVSFLSGTLIPYSHTQLVLYSYCTHYAALILYSLYRYSHTQLVLYSYCTHYTALILYTHYTGTLIPSSSRGSRWAGLARSSDWYRTIVEGIANVSLNTVNTGPRPLDGFNLWPAILSNLSSHRTEVIHYTHCAHPLHTLCSYTHTLSGHPPSEQQLHQRPVWTHPAPH